MSEVVPASTHRDQRAPFLVIEPGVTDPLTTALYIHKDMVLAREPWAVEEHIGPIKADEVFGDVESWTAYVLAHGTVESDGLITWNATGLRAVLDYHSGDGEPGRCQWVARHPFRLAREWQAWQALTTKALTQRELIERLEDLGENITEPSAAAIVEMLRDLRANASASATTVLREDGTTDVEFSKSNTVKAGKLALPPTITINIPVVHGHPDRFSLTVRVRVSVDDNAHLAFRLSIPNAEATFELVCSELVAKAKELLGADYTILRAAD